ncbi:hypothetical protein HPB51_018276 [Rhipicephalus microplus]|uniref:Uncharacterized protein n=1 Tax=Rhipicephalus microplus TaxID=6941 RepID=A0A9J6D6Y5_RHIMP|nr:hypothetical protein HPB51_018276 [Rhipicephalus microplus]
MQVNVLCVARVARVFLPLLRKSPYSGRRFVIVNSVWSRMAVPGTGPYCMSKYAVRCFTEVLRRELLKFGIYVVGIEPNLYRLPQTEPSSLLKSYKYMWNKLPDDVKDIYSRVSLVRHDSEEHDAWHACIPILFEKKIRQIPRTG